LGLLRLTPDKMVGAFGSCTCVGEIADEAIPLEDGETEPGRLVLNLLPDRLGPLNVDDGAASMEVETDWARVAIRVGVTSLRVMMATVVEVLPRARRFGLSRVLNKFGRMAGVSDRLCLVKESLLRDALATADKALEESSDKELAPLLDDRIKASSRCSKETALEVPRLGVTVLPEDWTPKDGSVSPDSNSGTFVVVSSPVHGGSDPLSASGAKDAVWVTSIWETVEG